MKRVVNISLITLCSMLLFWSCGDKTPSAEDIGKKFLTAMVDGNESAATALCYDNEAKTIVLAAIPDFKGNKYTTGDASEYANGNATDIPYQLNGEEQKLTLKKHNEKGWLVKFRFSSPGAVAMVFLKAMANKDYETAKEFATKDSGTGIDMMSGMGDGSSEGGNADAIIIGAVKIDGDNATVQYTDEGKALTLEMEKIGDNWKAVWSKGGPDGDTNDLGLGDIGKDLEDAMEDALKDLSEGLEDLSTDDTNEE